MRFDFISNDDFKTILRKDYEELLRCQEAKAWKSVVVLCGSVIEAILTEYFHTHTPSNLTQSKILKLKFFELIQLASDQKLLNPQTSAISTVLKDYRNLIHPSVVYRKGEVDQDTATISMSLLNLVIKDVEINYFQNGSVTAIDVFEKLKQEPMSINLFRTIVNRLNRVQKVKLLEVISIHEVENRDEIVAGAEYVEVLKTIIPDDEIRKFVQQLVNEVNYGTRDSFYQYFLQFYDKIHLLKDEEIELVILYQIDYLKEILIGKYFDDENFAKAFVIGQYCIQIGKREMLLDFLNYMCINFIAYTNDYSAQSGYYTLLEYVFKSVDTVESTIGKSSCQEFFDTYTLLY